MTVATPRLFTFFIVVHNAATFAAAALPTAPGQKTFGHAIKNGHLPTNTETTVFEHKCKTPPCAITQIHCPTVGPVGWTKATIKIYINGEKKPSIEVTLLELAHVGKFNFMGNERGHQPWGIGLFGHTATEGGVYSTVRIPFTSKVRVSLTTSHVGDNMYWFMVHGVEAYPVILGDLVLPTSARLRVYRVSQAQLDSKDFITMATVPQGTSGAVLSVQLDSTSENYKYLEACLRAYIDGSVKPLFLSSGGEDYFLSAFHLDEYSIPRSDNFKTPNSGLTYFNGRGKMSAYKNHERDPLLFSNGLRLVWRNCEDARGCGNMTHCPNQWCSPGTAAVEVPPSSTERLGTTSARATFDTTVWVYEWPKIISGPGAASCPGGAIEHCMSACPSEPLAAFRVCTATCSKRCDDTTTATVTV